MKHSVLQSGDALLAQTAVNTNDIYGATADVLEAQLNQETGCHVVKDYSKNGDPDCQYVMVFEDKIAPLNQLAANCVPATICEPDVVGMTKGKIATYGVVMQVLQKNLGQLIWLGQGDPATCLQRMTEVRSTVVWAVPCCCSFWQGSSYELSQLCIRHAELT